MRNCVVRAAVAVALAGGVSLGGPAVAGADPAVKQITASDVSVTEGDSGTQNAVVTVSVPPSQKNDTIFYRTFDGVGTTAGTDYVATSGQLSVDRSGSATISVPIIGNLDYQPYSRTVTVEWSPDDVSWASIATITINDNDPKPVNTATVSVNAAGDTLRIASSDGSSINCGYMGGGQCTNDFPVGTVLTLTAYDSRFYTFDSWSGDCASAGTSRTCTLTIDGPKSISATDHAI